MKQQKAEVDHLVIDNFLDVAVLDLCGHLRVGKSSSDITADGVERDVFEGLEDLECLAVEAEKGLSNKTFPLVLSSFNLPHNYGCIGYRGILRLYNIMNDLHFIKV